MEELRTIPTTIKNIEMPFFSMVSFMVKWAVATIPAALILVAFGVSASMFFAALIK